MSCYCGISAIFFQFCCLIETHVNDSFQFSRAFFLGITSWQGASLFNGKGGGGYFSAGHPMGGISIDGQVLGKVVGWMGGGGREGEGGTTPHVPLLWE